MEKPTEGVALKSSVVDVLSYVADRGILKPKFNPEYGYYYEIPGSSLDRETLMELLDELASEGYLDRRLYFKPVRCPSCRSYDVSVFYVCPHCGSRDFEKQVLVEHIPCGYIGTIEGFQRNGGTRCPRCRVEVKPETLRKVGVWFRCMNCGRASPNLTPMHLCKKCGLEFTLNDADFDVIYTYRITRLGERRLSDERAIHRPLADVFKEHGYVPETKSRIRGVSGVAHTLSMLFRDSSGSKVGIVFIPADKKIGVENVVKFVSEITDLEIPLIFVTPKELDDNVKKLANYYNVKIVSSSDLEELKNKIRELLSKDVLRRVGSAT